YGCGITLIEWADRVEHLLPAEYLTVELHYLEETKRRVILRPHGQRFLALLEAFKQATFAQQRQAI
ncbi:MAG TPA: tRNA (adenosine(37)-N6)-threonylcarbamoyltransferase complex ATPase subunit type 1 TsaE, partial [Anaerolineae bacterium]|nr:tRNA (adenosine(37)-N6)-threonylcarbamoyltransferase complex ATPase subunit type 1 TsaE [Anaerolineae bacterium]